MIVGYLDKNGYAYDIELGKIKKRIFDDYGNLIFEEDEQIVKIGEHRTEISTKWRNWLFTPIFKIGIGELIKTNKRLIFFRQPSVMRGFREFSAFSAHVAVSDMWTAKKLNEIGAKEFFEFYIDEFVWFKKPYYLCFLMNNEKYKLLICPNKEPIINFLGDLVKINKLKNLK